MTRAKILLLDAGRGESHAEELLFLLRSGLAEVEIFVEKTDDVIAEEIGRAPADAVIALLPNAAADRIQTMLRRLLRRFDQPVIVFCAARDSGEMIQLLHMGAADVISPETNVVEIAPRVWRLIEQNQDREGELVRKLKKKIGIQNIIGKSKSLTAELKKIPLAARCDVTVMIGGETGTGKELFARAIHYLSPRAGKPFAPINCGAIPLDLVENELFGHKAGAFTGAQGSSEGLIRETEGGTLFLDEIDCLPPAAQVKLLRFLQDKEYRQLGSAKLIKSDIRIIAATNFPLREAVKRGKIREDLFYRLNVFPFYLPPLKERHGDIPLLAEHFLQKYAAEFDSTVTRFSSEALRRLSMHQWPGNVRELEYTIQRAIVLAEADCIEQEQIQFPETDMQPAAMRSFKEAKNQVVRDFEKAYIQALLTAHRGNISMAARAAQKNRRAFFELMRKHRIQPSEFRG